MQIRHSCLEMQPNAMLDQSSIRPLHRHQHRRAQSDDHRGCLGLVGGSVDVDTFQPLTIKSSDKFVRLADMKLESRDDGPCLLYRQRSTSMPCLAHLPIQGLGVGGRSEPFEKVDEASLEDSSESPEDEEESTSTETTDHEMLLLDKKAENETVQIAARTLHNDLKRETTLTALIEAGRWRDVLTIVEEEPSLCRKPSSMVCQGEVVECSPLHAAICQKDVTMDVVAAMVTTIPAQLLKGDSRGGRLPLHIALMRSAADWLVRYLVKAQPAALQVADSDGNLPMHLAAMYAGPTVIEFLLQEYPGACCVAGYHDRLPLHILCARSFDSAALSPSIVSRMIEVHPDSVSTVDRHGRRPLHCACARRYLVWDVLELLIHADSESLLAKDKTKQTPLQLARRWKQSAHDNDVVLASLAESTAKERRRHGLLHGLFRMPAKGKKNHEAEALYHCYG